MRILTSVKISTEDGQYEFQIADTMVLIFRCPGGATLQAYIHSMLTSGNRKFVGCGLIPSEIAATARHLYTMDSSEMGDRENQMSEQMDDFLYQLAVSCTQ